MDRDLRTAALWVGIVFCLALIAMTVAVVADFEFERLTLSVILFVAFVLGGLLLIGLILVALISALRNPPED